MKKGMLLLLVMNLIKKKSCYGKEMIRIIKAETGIEIAEGTLYPILKKLKQEQLVVTKWVGVEGDERPKKYYYLTGKGGNLLQEINVKWGKLSLSYSSILNYTHLPN